MDEHGSIVGYDFKTVLAFAAIYIRVPQRRCWPVVVCSWHFLRRSRSSGLHPPWALPAILALIYLVTAGSIAGFTAYTWLLGRMPATTVASYAYVNPVVALLLGRLFGGEEISTQTLCGSAVIVVSVILLLRAQDEKCAHVGEC
jgi:drug/metabolite transporter (DMT)-like permease